MSSKIPRNAFSHFIVHLHKIIEFSVINLHQQLVYFLTVFALPIRNSPPVLTTVLFEYGILWNAQKSGFYEVRLVFNRKVSFDFNRFCKNVGYHVGVEKADAQLTQSTDHLWPNWKQLLIRIVWMWCVMWQRSPELWAVHLDGALNTWLPLATRHDRHD
jgi:hypothetical protein